MSKEGITFEECDSLVKEFERVVKSPVTNGSSVYYTGVDLGTACVVVAVLDDNFKPVAGAYRYADVVRDGMVVDYIGAIRIVREMKEELEEKLGFYMRRPPFLPGPTSWIREPSKMWFRARALRSRLFSMSQPQPTPC